MEKNPLEGLLGNFVTSDNEIFVNFVTLVEVVDAKGDYGLRLYCSDTITPWLAQGMLHAGIDMILEGECDHDEND